MNFVTEFVADEPYRQEALQIVLDEQLLGRGLETAIARPRGTPCRTRPSG